MKKQYIYNLHCSYLKVSVQRTVVMLSPWKSLAWVHNVAHRIVHYIQATLATLTGVRNVPDLLGFATIIQRMKTARLIN